MRLRILSFTDPGVRYDVATGRCRCPSRVRPCKHEKVVAAVEALAAQCHLLHGTEDGLVCVQCVADALAVTSANVAKHFVPRPVPAPPKTRAEIIKRRVDRTRAALASGPRDQL